MTKLEFLTALKDYEISNNTFDISKITAMVPEKDYNDLATPDVMHITKEVPGIEHMISQRFVVSPKIEKLWFCSREAADKWLEENK